MAYIYYIAGEKMELAEAELKGFLRSQELEDEVKRQGKICFTESHPSQLRRLGLVHEVSELLDRRKDLELDYRPEGSFAVRAYDFTGEEDVPELEEALGKQLETGENQVDLEDPEEVINLYVLEDEYVFATRIQDIDRGLFQERKNQERPFSSPVSLDPVLARVLVNLSEIPAGGKILDPFCGTGGILLEAGLCGILPFGIDVKKEMVEGTRENLENYGIINHRIRKGSVAEIDKQFKKEFDGIVTDLPYGKASKLEGSPAETFLEVTPEFTDGRIVFMYDQPEVKGHQADFEIYVHKNLTRYIYRV